LHLNEPNGGSVASSGGLYYESFYVRNDSGQYYKIINYDLASSISDTSTSNYFNILLSLIKEAEAKKADEDSSDSDTSSSDLFEEAIEDLEVKVPPTSLKEAAARYPPFWRVQDKLR